VDRVDRLPGGEVLVLDLKRGDPKPEAAGAAPVRFQLPLYALALAREERVAGSAFLSVAKRHLRGRFREALKADHAPFAVQRSPGQWLSDDEWTAWLAAAAARAREIVAAIRRGELDPSPRVGEDVCRYCPFPLLCREARRGKGVPGADGEDEP
jgi:RecB family exonuclease